MISSRLPDLSAERELVVWFLTLAAILLVSLRVSMVIRHGLALDRSYPLTWTREQIGYLRVALSSIGIVLIATWLVLFAASPFLPMRYPFSQSNAVLLIGLLLLTYTWVVMARPHHWTVAPLAHAKFNLVLCTVVIWWTTALGLVLYWIARLSIPQIFLEPAMMTGAYA